MKLTHPNTWHNNADAFKSPVVFSEMASCAPIER